MSEQTQAPSNREIPLTPAQQRMQLARNVLAARQLLRNEQPEFPITPNELVTIRDAHEPNSADHTGLTRIIDQLRAMQNIQQTPEQPSSPTPEPPGRLAATANKAKTAAFLTAASVFGASGGAGAAAAYDLGRTTKEVGLTPETAVLGLETLGFATLAAVAATAATSFRNRAQRPRSATTQLAPPPSPLLPQPTDIPPAIPYGGESREQGIDPDRATQRAPHDTRPLTATPMTPTERPAAPQPPSPLIRPPAPGDTTGEPSRSPTRSTAELAGNLRSADFIDEEPNNSPENTDLEPHFNGELAEQATRIITTTSNTPGETSRRNFVLSELGFPGGNFEEGLPPGTLYLWTETVPESTLASGAIRPEHIVISGGGMVANVRNAVRPYTFITNFPPGEASEAFLEDIRAGGERAATALRLIEDRRATESNTERYPGLDFDIATTFVEPTTYLADLHARSAPPRSTEEIPPSADVSPALAGPTEELPSTVATQPSTAQNSGLPPRIPGANLPPTAKAKDEPLPPVPNRDPEEARRRLEQLNRTEPLSSASRVEAQAETGDQTTNNDPLAFEEL